MWDFNALIGLLMRRDMWEAFYTTSRKKKVPLPPGCVPECGRNGNFLPLKKASRKIFQSSRP